MTTNFCTEEDKEIEFKPKDKYISNAVAGRLLFSQRHARGGFRLRYGRSRAAGLLSHFDSPCHYASHRWFHHSSDPNENRTDGKATVVSPCDTIEGPYIQFGAAARLAVFNDEIT